MAVRQPSKEPQKVPEPNEEGLIESRVNPDFPPGTEITRFPGSLSNYQGYPKSGAMGITFLVAFEDVDKAWPLTRLTGLEFELVLRRPEKRFDELEQQERDEKGLDTGWDDLARRFA